MTNSSPVLLSQESKSSELYQQTIQMFSSRIFKLDHQSPTKSEKGIQTTPVDHQSIINQYKNSISQSYEKREIINAKQLAKSQELQKLKALQNDLSQTFDIGDVSSSRDKYQKNMEQLNISIEQRSQLEEQLSQLKNSLSSSGTSSILEKMSSPQSAAPCNVIKQSSDVQCSSEQVSNSIKSLIYTNKIYSNYKEVLIKDYQQAKQLIDNNIELFSPNEGIFKENTGFEKCDNEQITKQFPLTNEYSENKTPQSNEMLNTLKNEYNQLNQQQQNQLHLINQLNQQLSTSNNAKLQSHLLLKQQQEILSKNENVTEKLHSTLQQINCQKSYQDYLHTYYKYNKSLKAYLDTLQQTKVLQRHESVVKQTLGEKLINDIDKQINKRKQLELEIRNQQNTIQQFTQFNKQLQELGESFKYTLNTCSPQQLTKIEQLLNNCSHMESENQKIIYELQELRANEHSINEQIDQMFMYLSIEDNETQENKKKANIAKIVRQFKENYKQLDDQMSSLKDILHQNINTQSNYQKQLLPIIQDQIQQYQLIKQKQQDKILNQQNKFETCRQQVEQVQQSIKTDIYQQIQSINDTVDTKIKQISELVNNKTNNIQQNETKKIEYQQQLNVQSHFIDEQVNNKQLYSKLMIDVQKCIKMLANSNSINMALLSGQNINNQIVQSVKCLNQLLNSQATAYKQQKEMIQKQIFNNEKQEKLSQQQITYIVGQIYQKLQQLGQKVEDCLQSSIEVYQSQVQNIKANISQLSQSSIYLTEQLSTQQEVNKQQEQMLLESQHNIEQLESQELQYQKCLESQIKLTDDEYHSLQLSQSSLSMYNQNLESYKIVGNKEYDTMKQSFQEYEKIKYKQDSAKDKQYKNKLRLEQLQHQNEILWLNMYTQQKYFDYLTNYQLNMLQNKAQLQYQQSIKFLEHQLQIMQEITQKLIITQKTIIPSTSTTKDPILVNGCKDEYALSLVSLQKIIRLQEQQFNNTYKLKFKYLNVK